MSSDTSRFVLVKPGDILLIGNVGHLLEDQAQIRAFGDVAQQLKETVGLKHVLVFQGDIDVSKLTADDVAQLG